MANENFYKTLDAIAAGVAPEITEVKKATVAEAAEMKKTLLNPQRVVDALSTNADISYEGALGDIADLSSLDFYNKYGYDRSGHGISSAVNARVFEAGAERTAPQIAGDTLLDLGQGVASIGSMAGAIAETGANFEVLNNAIEGMTGVNPGRSLGRFLRQQSEAASDALEGLQSYERQKQNNLYNRDREIEAEDNLLAYEKKVEGGQDALLSSLERIGSDFRDNAGAVLSDPAKLSELVVESLPSLVLTGGAANVGAKAIAGAAASKEVLAETATRLVPALVGVMEGSDAASGIYAEIDATPDQTLMEMSPEYAQMRQDGVNEADAKSKLAATPALQAGLTQAAIGVVSGKLNAKFEANPFARAGGVRGLGSSIGLETLEEAIQSGSQPLTTNVAMQAYVDPERDLAAGVGRGIAEGALAGAGMPIATQGPATALGAGRKAAQAVNEAVIEPVVETVQAGLAAKAEEATQQVEAEAQAANDAAAAADTAQASTVHERLKTKLKDDMVFDDQTIADNFEAATKDALDTPESKTLTGAITKVSDKFAEDLNVFNNSTDPNTPEFQESFSRMKAYASDMQMLLQGVEGSVRDLAQKEDQTEDDKHDLKEMTDYLETLKRDPKIGQIMQFSMRLAQQNAPQTQADAVQVADAAMADPINMPEENITKAMEIAGQDLEAARKRVITAPADTITQLAGALNIKKIATFHEQERVAMNRSPETQNRNTTEDVSDNILTTGFKSGDGEKRSLVQYANTINDAMKMGDEQYAQDVMEELEAFQFTMADKLRALHNSSVNWGSTESYMSTSDREFFDSVMTETGSELTLYRNIDNSIQLYRNIHNDATAVTAFLNTLSEMYPQLGIKAKPMPVFSKSVAQHAKLNADYQAQVDALGKPEGMPKNRPLRQQKAKPVLKPSEQVVSAKELATLRKEAGGDKPLIQYLKSIGGIHQDSAFAQELQAMGINRKDIPGLINNTSQRGELDNIEVGLENDYLAETIGESNNYLSRDGLLQAIADEVRGEPRHVRYDQKNAADALAAYEAEIARLQEQEAASEPVSEEEEDVELIEKEERQVSTTEANKTEEAEAPKSLGERFPLLRKAADGVSYLMKKYQARKLVPDVWLQGKPMFKAIADATKGMVNGKATRDLLALGNTLADSVNQSMEKQLGSYITPEKLDTDTDFSGQQVGRFTPLMEKTEEGKWQLNQDFVQAASAAALEWLGKMVTVQPKSANQIARALGLDEAVLDPALVNALNSGTAAFAAKRELGQMIAKFWAIEAKDDLVSPDAMFEQMAEVLIRNMQAMGLLTAATQTYTDAAGKPNDIMLFSLNGAVFTNEMKENIKSQYGNLTSLFTNEQEKEMYIGAPVDPKTKPKGRHKNSRNKLKALETRATEVLDKTPYKVNPMMHAFMAAMGKAIPTMVEGDIPLALAASFGYIHNLKEENYNRRDYQTLLGKNRSIINGIRNSLATVDRMDAYGQANGQKLNDVPIFFRHVVNVVGRIQQQGLITPQANKIMRELVVSTWATLDLNKDSDQLAFWLTAGQMSELKFGPEKKKIEYLDPKVARGLIEETVRKEYGTLIKFFEDMEASELKEFDAAGYYNAMMSATKNKGLSPMALHAIMAVGRYDAAKAKGGAAWNQFQHGLALEADGVTNGPAGVFFKFSVHDFEPKVLEMYERIGIFFSEEQKNLYNRSVNDDLYEYNTKTTLTNIQATHQAIEEKSKPTDRVTTLRARTALENMLRTFKTKGLTITNDPVSGSNSWEMDRNALKNPLTQIIYGAGEMGVANGLVAAMLNELYSQLSAYMKREEGDNRTFSEFVGYPGDLDADLNLLTNHVTINAKKTAFVMRAKDRNDNTLAYVHNDIGSLDKKGLQEYQIVGTSFENLAKNLQTFYVKPMHSAVVANLGSAYDTMQMFIKTSQIQNMFFQFIYNREVEAYRKANGMKEMDMLSKKGRREVEKAVRKYMPWIESEQQDFDLSGMVEKLATYTNAKGDERVRVSSQSFDPSTTTGFASFDETVGDIGVRAAPNLNIGTGDGLMMLYGNAAIPDHLNRVLSVYDGQNMPADAIEELSLIMNEAVFKAWNTNTAMDVSNSHTSFLRELSEDILQDFMADKKRFKELAKALGYFGDDQPTPSDVRAMMRIQNEALRLRAETIQDIMDVRGEVSYSTDQMAAASKSFQSKGEKITGNPSEFLSNKLHELRQNQMNKGETADNKRFLEGVQKFGTKLHERGVYRIKAKHVKKLMGYLNKDQRILFTRIVEASLEKSEYTIYLGSTAELEAFRKDVQKIDDGKSLGEGLFSPANKSIYLTTASASTFAHEMLHHAVAGVIEDYYNNPKDGQVADAVKRLEILMDDFRNLNTEFDTSPYASTAMETLNQVLDNIDNAGNMTAAQKKAAKLNEFVAWTLSDPHLASIAQSQTVRNPLVRIAKEAMTIIKKLLGLQNVDAGKDYFSQIRFNAQVLSQFGLDANQALNQASTVNGSGSRMDLLARELTDATLRMVRKLSPTVAGAAVKMSTTMRDPAANVKALLSAYGYTFTSQESALFSQMMAFFETTQKYAPATLVRLHGLVDELIGKLDESHFLVDPKTADPAAKAHAESLLKVVVGSNLLTNNTKSRKDLLPVFLSLAAVNDEFRNALDKVARDKKSKIKVEDLDSLLYRTTEMALGSMTDRIIGTNKNQTMTAALDQLTLNLVRYQGETVMDVESVAQTSLDRGDKYLAERIQSLSGKAAKKLRDLAPTSPAQGIVDQSLNRMRQGALAAMGLVNKAEGKASGDQITRMLNDQGANVALRNLFASVRGFTDSNKNFYKLMNKVKSTIQALRQEYRSRVPELINGEFRTKLTATHQKALHTAIGKTDLASLLSAYSLSDIRDFLSNASKLDAEITKISKGHGRLYNLRATQLSKYMIHGELAADMRANAYAIARMLERNPSDALVDSLDHLVTLLAIREMDQQTKDVIADLVQKDAEAIDKSILYLATYRAKENAKNQSNIVRENQWKGYIPSQNMSGHAVQLVERSERATLEMQGWAYVADYVGSDVDRYRKDYVVMTTTTKNMARYTQGIIQTAERSQNGIDIKTGRTLYGGASGAITGSAAKRITRLIQNNGQVVLNGEHLRPLFDENGNIFAYERMMNPKYLAHLNRETDFAKSVGEWAGRQIEEEMVTEFNKTAVDELKRVYDADPNKGAYENLARSTDPIYKDAWDNIPRDTKAYIETVFGKKNFPLRRDMIENAVGYRMASVTDAWTGKSRMPKEATKAVHDLFVSFYGKEAYAKLARSERILQTGVSSVKDLIIVKSFVVPMGNIISNVWQLSMRGVPLSTIVKVGPKVFTEITQYLKNRDTEIELQFKLSSESDPVQKRRLEARIDLLQSMNKKLFIWPLIEAGEFTTVAEGMTEMDASLMDGKIGQWIERQVDQMPTVFKELGRQGLLVKDTALYQGLDRMTQYGDFLAKAIYYQHLTENKKVSGEAAMEKVTQEFINYNLVSGRTQDYLESVGLMWFWKFKLRALTVAMDMVQENPLRLVLHGAVPLNIDSVVEDNIIAKIASGNIGYSLGWGMGINAFGLNPWANGVDYILS